MIWLRRLRLFLLRDRATRELEDEMRLHRELRAAALVAEGVTADSAAVAARRAFGNPMQLTERSRDAWGFPWLDELRQDMRYAARRLRQRPAFSASVIVILALGIGATTAMFSAVDAAMLRPLPFAHPGQLVALPNVNVPFDPGAMSPTGSAQPHSTSPAHWLDVNDIAEMARLFSSVAAYAAGGLNLSDADHPTRLNAGVVTANFFATLGVRPLIGRDFSAAEGKPGAPHVALLSYGLWRRQFGGRDMVNQIVRLNDKPYVVIGVMPRGALFPSQSDLWIPMSLPTTFETFAAFRNYLPSTVIARLAPGMNTHLAAAQLLAEWQRNLGPGLKTDATGQYRELLDELQHGAVVPLQQSLVGDRRAALLVLLGATGLLLLLACANVVNLLLSESASRRREMAVREVLGATRSRMIRQLVVESTLLACIAALAGVLIAPASLGLLRALLPAALAGVAPAEIDLRVLAFALAIGLASGIGFGLWPALGTATPAPGEVIKSGGGHGGTAARGGRVRRALVSAELALAVMLLIGAGLMLRSFEQLMDVDRGLDTEHVGTLEMSFNTTDDSGGTRRLDRMHRILAQLAATPGITASGITNDLPLSSSGGIGLSIVVPGAPDPKPGEMSFARYLVASPGYFAALRILIVSGRAFNAGDNGTGQEVAIINRAMAKKYWPGRNPVGLTFGEGGDSSYIRVVGVAADVRESLDDAPGAQMYFPIDAQPSNNIAVVARGDLPARALLARMAAAVRSVDPTQAIYHLRTMDDVLGTSVAPRRTNTLLISLFATLALILASLGVYAVVSQGVAQRAREFGIRTALGASGGNLLAMVSREMLATAAVGVAAGLAGAWLITRLAEHLLYGVTPHDTATFVVVPVVLLVPALIATLIPARRAARVNPAEVMRAE